MDGPEPVDPLAHPAARACRLNFLEFCRELARWSGPDGVVEERDGVLVWATASEFPVSLTGVGRRDPETPAAGGIEVGGQWFGPRNGGFTVNAVEGPDDDLAAAAEVAGLLMMRDSPQMLIDAPVLPPQPGDGVGLEW